MSFRYCAVIAAPFLVAVGGVALGQAQVTGNAFNPAISLILNGHYAHYERDPDPYLLPGYLLGAEAGPPEEGLSLEETELALSANVDDKFYGSVTASLTQTRDDTSVSLEEAYLETLTLPHGFKVKAGRFLSDVGYLNPIHSHAWDFADAPLAYAALLDGAYADTGVQLRWVAPTDLYLEAGGELLRGDGFPGADGAGSRGTGAATLFAHVGGDVGATSSWRAGVSRISADANARRSALATGAASFDGTSDVTIADFVWKWARTGNPKDRYYVVQGEYLRRSERGVLTLEPLAVGSGAAYDGDQSGFYLQGVYQFRPRWRAGLRFDRLDATNAVTFALPTSSGLPPPLDASHDPRRVSVMADFSNSEFSRLRLQFNRDDSRAQTDRQWIFQYLMSLGAHGAHRF
jgi:hypothetical protein